MVNLHIVTYNCFANVCKTLYSLVKGVNTTWREMILTYTPGGSGSTTKWRGLSWPSWTWRREVGSHRWQLKLFNVWWAVITEVWYSHCLSGQASVGSSDMNHVTAKPLSNQSTLTVLPGRGSTACSRWRCRGNVVYSNSSRGWIAKLYWRGCHSFTEATNEGIYRDKLKAVGNSW